MLEGNQPLLQYCTVTSCWLVGAAVGCGTDVGAAVGVAGEAQAANIASAAIRVRPLKMRLLWPIGHAPFLVSNRAGPCGRPARTERRSEEKSSSVKPISLLDLGNW